MWEGGGREAGRDLHATSEPRTAIDSVVDVVIRHWYGDQA